MKEKVSDENFSCCHVGIAIHAEFSECMGVALTQRSPTDSHVCFVILVEDDESWYVQTGSGASSYWLPEMVSIMERTLNWVKSNCNIDPKGYGWSFK